MRVLPRFRVVGAVLNEVLESAGDAAANPAVWPTAGDQAKGVPSLGVMYGGLGGVGGND